MYPWLPEGPLTTQWAPMQSSEGPWFPGPLVAGGPGRIGAPDRLGPLVAKAAPG